LLPAHLPSANNLTGRPARAADRALFDFAIDSKLRGCDVVKVRIGDIVAGGRIRDRAVVVQQKTKRPVGLSWLSRLERPCSPGLSAVAARSTTSSSRAGTTTWDT